MEVMSEKPRCNGQDKKGKKTTKVELSLGKNGGIFILLGGALVTALISSAFRKQRKPRGKDESHRGTPLKSTAAEEEEEEEEEESREAGDEQKNNICEDEDPVRKGLQFILSGPSSLMQGHLSQFDQIFSVQRIKDDGEGDYNVRKEINETTEKEERSLKIQASEEQDSPANGCHQEIISNGSSIPGSATSSEQEYSSSQPFYTHPLFEQANSEDIRLTKMNETMKISVEEEVKEVLPEEMECSEKNCSPEIEMGLCDGPDAMYSSPEMQGNDDQKNTNSEQVTSEITHPEDCETNVPNLDLLAAFHVPLHIKNSNEVSTTPKENGSTNEPEEEEEEEEEDNPIPTIQFVAKQHCNDYCKGGVSMADEKALGQYSSMDKEGEEVAGNEEEETNQNIEKTLGEDGVTGDTATAKQHPILPSNDKEGDEETTDAGNNECDYDEEYGYGDGDDDLSEEMEEGSEVGLISSDESDDDGAIWPAEPAQTPLMGLKGPKEEIEDDRTLKTEAHINLKTINNSKLQTGDCRGDLRMKNIQTSARKHMILDNLVACSLQSKRIILAGTVTLLIAYSCSWYFELPYLKPSLVVIAAMFLSKVLAG